MSTTKQPVATKVALTVTGLGTLASATFVASAAKDNTTNQPLDVAVEVIAFTSNTPSGNKQLVVYAKMSLDGTNYQSGTESGTATDNESELTLLGFVPIPTVSQTASKTFSVAQQFGFCPPFFKVVLKNELGVALTSASVNNAELSSTSS